MTNPQRDLQFFDSIREELNSRVSCEIGSLLLKIEQFLRRTTFYNILPRAYKTYHVLFSHPTWRI